MWHFSIDYDVKKFLNTSEWEAVEETWSQIAMQYRYSDILELVPLKHLSKFGYKQFCKVEPWKFMY